jgi:PAS domain S-box-containing protein
MAKRSPEAAEKWLSNLLASITDGVVILDQGWRYKYVNAAAEHLLGCSRDELLGRVVWEVYPGELGTAREQESRRAVSDNVPVVLENYWAPTERWLETSVYPLKHEGLIAYFRDVTDGKHMEEALRESEERFRLATKATNDAIWDIDLKTGTVSWNDTYSVLYGRPPETSGSWQWWIESIHPEDGERTVGELRAAIGSGESSWTSEYRFRRVNGEWAYIYDRAYIARDASGNAWRVIGAMQDLTERKLAEAALRESEERFRRVFEEGPLGVALVGRDNRFLKVNSAPLSNGRLRRGGTCTDVLRRNNTPG